MDKGREVNIGYISSPIAELAQLGLLGVSGLSKGSCSLAPLWVNSENRKQYMNLTA